ncbi:MAG: hypothetical protein Q7L19_13045 [Pseudohongiella sp.]|nr:hypothetical protein [Pseudohongiella sp.]
MSKAVLEINDHAMGLYNHNGLIVSSPAYVLAHGKQPQFGQQAIEQSRIHPVSTNNEFWYRLGMTPLSRPLAHFRHYADIAHGHLMHLAQQGSFDGEVVVAVPASFNREQLAVLSGIIQHSPFKTLAIMDSALIAANHLPENQNLVYVDLQLHQLSFTRLLNEAGSVRRDAFAVVPGAGFIALSNTIVQVATDAFIAQSRFNPQHSAVWEQQLYNELPSWLQQFQSGQQEILVQINTGKNTVQARVSVSEVLESLQAVFQKISQHFAQFVSHTAMPVVLSERAARIPGLAFCLKASPLTVSGEQLAEICMRALPASSAAGNGVTYISSVAREPSSARTTSSAPATTDTDIDTGTDSGTARTPTHILYQAQAWPLPLTAHIDSAKKLILDSGSARREGELFRIESDGINVAINTAGTDMLLAGQKISGTKRLAVGDVISVKSLAAEIQCIQVRA